MQPHRRKVNTRLSHCCGINGNGINAAGNHGHHIAINAVVLQIYDLITSNHAQPSGRFSEPGICRYLHSSFSWMAI
jgi:hypothetical protein